MKLTKSMSKKSQEISSKKGNEVINDLLMKPFSLGWTREVVRRVVTRSKAPDFDIYYFSPDKKRKLRSLTEVKSYLTVGLSPECFSFKRQPLGLSSDLEIIRNAKVRGKGTEKSLKRKSVSEKVKGPMGHENSEQKVENSESEAKTETKEVEKKESKLNFEAVDNKDKLVTTKKENEEVIKNSETNHKRKVVEKQLNESKSFNIRKKTKAKPSKSTKPARLQSIKNKKRVLKSVINAKQDKQSKVVTNKKLRKEILSENVALPRRKLSRPREDKKSVLKTIKNKSIKVKSEKKPLKNSLTKIKTEITKAPEVNETGKKSPAKDLKSIVEENIEKYREMRERQKLETKTRTRNSSRKIAYADVSTPRNRSKPISKNRLFYLKPLEKGWRRELVYRTNCTKAGQQADVYYFHPSGKKLRSCREIAENLTHGLSIECFTFRKEPIGCGEPSEIIRNARLHQRNKAIL